VAVDMIGFGRSDKPALDYTYDTHYRYIEAFIAAQKLSDFILIGHNWGATIALDYARRHPGDAAGVVLIEPIVPPSYPRDEFASELFRDFRDAEKGKKLLIEDNVFIEEVLPWGILRELSEVEMEAYRGPFKKREDRLPLYRWPNEIPVAGEPERNIVLLGTLGNWMKTSSLPKLLQYGSPGAIVPPETAQWMASHYLNMELQFVGRGRMTLQEDHPEAIGRGITEWYRRLR
jgi:haloalkane dehalogenase